MDIADGRSDLQRLQRTRKLRMLAMTLLLVPVVLLVGPAWPQDGVIGEGIEAVGALLIVLAIFGRTWCTLYIGGRKRRELVTNGPYSVVRHPLYVFSIVAVIGLGAQSGSLIVACLAAAVLGWPLAAVARSEERALRETFGTAYDDYAARVPAFVPDPRLWRDVDALEIRPAFVRRTFLEASLILIAIPLAEFIHALQARGVLPVLLRLK
jgi:protein-S-isoprenylcysteine O-methyltransferase Ste14